MNSPGTVYDIAITGGGLAGLTLAIQCADAGYSTILFERETYPFHKVCGEYISMESLPFLQRLGFPSQQFHLPLINQLQLTNVKGTAYNFNLPVGGFGISRYTLDDTLYQLALQKGVQILTATKVQDIHFLNGLFTIETASQNYTAKIAAGCFGKRSNLDVKWNRSFIHTKPNKLSNYIGIKYHIQYPFPKESIALHNFTNGYCGISNIEQDKCCLCYLATAQNLKQNNNSIPHMEQNILYQNPALKKIFTTATFLYPQPLVISQVSFAQKNQVANHVLFIGDAAGLITPLCGNGMSMAMHASQVAFGYIHAFLQQQITRPAMEAAYTARWQQLFSKRLFMGRTVQRLFGNDKSTTLFLTLMHKTPWLANKIISATHGNAF